MKESSFCSSISILLKQAEGVSGGIFAIGDEKITMFYHISIGPRNCQGFRDMLQFKWINAVIKVGRKSEWSFCGMVGK